MQNSLEQLAEKIGQELQHLRLKLTTAESCTGGKLASAITKIAGCSEWFERGFITYSNEAKKELLKVNQSTLEKFGAVSEQTALEMAYGAITHSHAQISIATTGIAGPTGGSIDKPVGTTWIAWNINEKSTATHYQFAGTREQIRLQTVAAALKNLLNLIKN